MDRCPMMPHQLLGRGDFKDTPINYDADFYIQVILKKVELTRRAVVTDKDNLWRDFHLKEMATRICGGSREKLTIRQVPQKGVGGEDEIFGDFAKLSFSEGPFPSSDKVNWNEGLEANPFDKICKFYGRHGNVFEFNAVLMDPKKRQRILEAVKGKVLAGEDPVGKLKAFKKRMEVYLRRILGGALDAEEVLGENVEGFFHGYFVAQRGHGRNVHQNLNVNVTADGQSLETAEILEGRTGRMEEEQSRLERVKIFGNGKRIGTVVKTGVEGQRNYNFTKLAKTDLEVEWGWGTKKEGKTCSVVLETNGGRVGLKMATVDGVQVGLQEIRGWVEEENEVLIGGKSLGKLLEEMEGAGGSVAIRAEKKVAKKVGSASAPGGFDCDSQEKLVVREITAPPQDFEEMKEEILKEVDKLDFSEGLPADKFCELRKHYVRQKDIFDLTSFLAVQELRDEMMASIRKKCEEDARVDKFEQRIDLFMDRVEKGTLQAREFLGGEDFQNVAAFFAGPRHNIRANLNINLLVEGNKVFKDITSWFGRLPPNNEEETGELVRVKIFGRGKRLVTIVNKKGKGDGVDVGQRGYQFTPHAKMGLEVKWKAVDVDGVEKECLVVLSLEEGQWSIGEAAINGETVDNPRIMELAKQNDKVVFRDKSLYQVCRGVVLGKENQEEGGPMGMEESANKSKGEGDRKWSSSGSEDGDGGNWEDMLKEIQEQNDRLGITESISKQIDQLRNSK